MTLLKTCQNRLNRPWSCGDHPHSAQNARKHWGPLTRSLTFTGHSGLKNTYWTLLAPRQRSVICVKTFFNPQHVVINADVRIELLYIYRFVCVVSLNYLSKLNKSTVSECYGSKNWKNHVASKQTAILSTHLSLAKIRMYLNWLIIQSKYILQITKGWAKTNKPLLVFQQTVLNVWQ